MVRIGNVDTAQEITFDGMQFIVLRKKVVTDLDSKNFGKEVVVGKSYLSNAKGVASHLADDVLAKSIEAGTLDIENELNILLNKLKESK